MNFRLVASLCLFFFLVHSAAVSVHAGEIPSLSSYLDADGQLQLPTDFVGTLDPKGYQMIAGAQAPRFVKSAATPQAKLFGAAGGCDGGVRALARGPDGIIYIGGDFRQCDQVQASGIVAYDPATRQFRALGSGVDRYVLAISVAGSDVYVGGVFRAAGGIVANNVARWDGSRWHALGAGVDLQVNALAADATGVYAGGIFTRAGSVAANRVARWDGSNWRALGSAEANGVDGPVHALAIYAGELAVGGDFSQAGSTSARSIAVWDGNGWKTLGQTALGGVDGRVMALVADEQALYIGGAFAIAGGSLASNVARFDGDWSPLGSPPAFGYAASINSLALVDSQLFAGGVTFGPGDVPQGIVGRLDVFRWDDLGEEYMSSPVLALAASDDGIFAGGYFNQADGASVRNVARFSEGSWGSLGDAGGSSIEGRIAAIAVLGEDIYVGGEFHSVGGITVNHIARWNGARWFALGGDSAGGGAGVSRPVRALAVYNGELVVGGLFDVAGNISARRIAIWDGERWSALGEGSDQGVRGASFSGVFALTATRAGVYVGGAFEQAGDVAASNIALWNGTHWSALAMDQAQGTDRSVYALNSDGSLLYVAGDFLLAGGLAAPGIASWDGQRWSTVGDLNGTIRAVASVQGRLYAAGFPLNADSAQGTPLNGIAAWDGSRWSALGEGIADPTGLAYIGALQAHQGRLYAAGFFSSAGGNPANSLAIWDGSTWTGLGNDALPQQINAIAFTDSGALVDGASLVQSGSAELQSVLADGGAGGGVNELAISQHANWVAFATSAALLETDTDNLADVYLRNRSSGELRQISLAGGALSSDQGIAFQLSGISSDGETVAFFGNGQIYAATRDGIVLVSASAQGEPGNGRSMRAQVLGFGALVLFESDATNLVVGAGTDSAQPNIYLKNIHSGQIQLLSVGANGEPASGGSFGASGSADGRVVAFSTYATNLSGEVSPGSEPGTAQLVLLALGEEGSSARYITRSSDGALGNGDSFAVRLTPNGRFGVFLSQADNLLADSAPGEGMQVLRFEIDDGQIRLRRVSQTTQGLRSAGDAFDPSISDDGQLVAFTLAQNDLFPLDGNGSDVVVQSMLTGQALRLANGVDGREYAGDSVSGQISGDGSAVLIASSADNLVAGDNNGSDDAFLLQLTAQNPAQATGPIAEPGVRAFALPAPLPANPNCPAGYYAALVDDGPAAGFHAGSFGMELLLDEPGDRLLQGGLNYGGLIDRSQPGFAGFNIANANGEAQRVTLSLTGNPWADLEGTLPVLLRVARRHPSGVEVVLESTVNIALAQTFESVLELSPGYYETSVSVLDGEPGGDPEGQFYFAVNTSFLDRPGGGFQGGAVVGGYHGEPQADSVSGFAAFCLATPHSVSARVLSAPSYGPEGAEDLRLRIHEAAEQRDLIVVPGG